MSVAVEAETLPTLDLRRFNGPASERSRFLEDLRKAARGAGFFYLVGDGIDDVLQQGGGTRVSSGVVMFSTGTRRR